MSKKFKLKSFLAGEEVRVIGPGGYKDVQFTGYLCSANNGDHVVYFTVDEHGVAMNSYKDSPLGVSSNLFFSLRRKKSNVKPQEIIPRDESAPTFAPPKEKPDVVEIVRHFRNIDGMTGGVSSFGGLTVICRLNYDTMCMQVFPAFCSPEDNFSKSTGFHKADHRRMDNVGIVCSFDRELSIRDNLGIAIVSNGYSYTSRDRLQNQILYREFNKCFEG